MYEINKLLHGKRFVRLFTLVGFVSEISLVRCAHSFDFRYLTNSCENPVRMRFPWSNLYFQDPTAKKLLQFQLIPTKSSWVLQNTSVSDPQEAAHALFLHCTVQLTGCPLKQVSLLGPKVLKAGINYEKIKRVKMWESMYKNVRAQSCTIGIYTHGKSSAFIFFSPLYKLRTQLQLPIARTANPVILRCVEVSKLYNLWRHQLWLTQKILVKGKLIEKTSFKFVCSTPMSFRVLKRMLFAFLAYGDVLQSFLGFHLFFQSWPATFSVSISSQRLSCVIGKSLQSAERSS